MNIGYIKHIFGWTDTCRVFSSIPMADAWVIFSSVSLQADRFCRNNLPQQMNSVSASCLSWIVGDLLKSTGTIHCWFYNISHRSLCWLSFFSFNSLFYVVDWTFPDYYFVVDVERASSEPAVTSKKCSATLPKRMRIWFCNSTFSRFSTSQFFPNTPSCIFNNIFVLLSV